MLHRAASTLRRFGTHAGGHVKEQVHAATHHQAETAMITNNVRSIFLSEHGNLEPALYILTCIYCFREPMYLCAKVLNGLHGWAFLVDLRCWLLVWITLRTQTLKIGVAAKQFVDLRRMTVSTCLDEIPPVDLMSMSR
jgi:hypothetical protein